MKNKMKNKNIKKTSKKNKSKKHKLIFFYLQYDNVVFQEVFEEYANINDYDHRYQHHTGDNWWKLQGQVHRRINRHGMGRTKLRKT